MRREVEREDKEFQSKQDIWQTEFRVLLAEPGVKPDNLDAGVHYIFSGNYTAVVKTDKGEEM